MKIQPWVWWRGNTYYQMSGVGTDKGGESLSMISGGLRTGFDDTISSVGERKNGSMHLGQYLSCVGIYEVPMSSNDKHPHIGIVG